MRSLAIDIGGTKIALALIEGQNLNHRRQIHTPRTGRGQDIVEAVLAVARSLPPADSVGVASTGIVDGGCLTALNPATLPIEDRFPLVDTLATGLGLPVTAVNDAQAAAWAEYRQGAGRGSAAMAFVTVSTGIGGGLILGEQLQVGRRGLAGHIGHVVVDPVGPACGCGRRGCVERLASGTAIGELGSAALGRPLAAPDVFAAANRGEPAAVAIVSGAASGLAALFADLAATVDVELVVLGGGVGLADGFLALVSAAMESQPAIYRRPVVQAELGADAGLFGAALLALDGNFHC